MLENISINPAIYAYGVILEKMWKIIGVFKMRSATLANTYDQFLSFLNDLKRIEEKAQDHSLFLSLNCKLLRNIVYYRFQNQMKLALFAYSLTPKGRSYFRINSNLEEPIELNNEQFIDAGDHFWELMSFSKKWKGLGEFAAIIISIPASEVENERLFSIKRNIVGRSATRISPKLLTARARLASKQ